MLRRLKSWIMPWIPVRRSAYVKMQNSLVDKLAYVKKDHEQELKKVTEEVKNIVERVCNIQFSRNRTGQCFQVTVLFDPRAFGGGMWVDNEWRHIAMYVGRQVEHQIATAKFLTSIRELENEMMEKM